MSRAIIIDSDALTRQTLRGIMANEGYEVVETADGQKGIAEVRSGEEISVIFLADQLAGLSGLDTLIAIRKFQPKVPVLMIMSTDNRQASQVALSRGAAWFLTRPVKVEDVLVIIRLLMEKKRLQRTIDQQVERLRLLEKQTGELTDIEDDGIAPEDVLKESEFLSRSIELIAGVLNAKKVSIMLLSRDGKELVMAKSNWILPSKIPTIRQPVGQGVSGRVVMDGKPMLVEDAAKDSRADTNEYARQYESSSFIVTPIFCGKRAIGVITANDKSDKSSFTEGDLALLNTFSNQMSMAIANLFMMKRTEREKLKLTFVNGIVQALVSSVDPDQIYKSLLSKVTTGLRATAGILAFADGSGSKLNFEYAIPENRIRIPEAPVPVGPGALAKVVKEGAIVICNNPGDKEGVDPASDFPPGLTVRSLAAAPLTANGKVLGVIAVFNKEDGLPFDEWDAEILQTVAPQASMAIKQAWLYQNLIKNIDEVVETNKQLENANREVREKVRELDRLKSKVTT
ncbi:MAG: GAF domain-containing protein [bacterium]|nr:GAF domain-containing protein [bacterium]